MQLDTKAVFDGWVSRVNQRNFAVSGPILSDRRINDTFLFESAECRQFERYSFRGTY